jgi:hypothetical protein
MGRNGWNWVELDGEGNTEGILLEWMPVQGISVRNEVIGDDVVTMVIVIIQSEPMTFQDDRSEARSLISEREFDGNRSCETFRYRRRSGCFRNLSLSVGQLIPEIRRTSMIEKSKVPI